MLSKKHTVVIAILLGASLAAGWFDGQSFRGSPHYERQNPTDQRAKVKPAEIRPDEQIADYTWWLAVLTGALVVVSLGQGFFLLRSDKTARMAATAALETADVAKKDLLASHRPLITIANLVLRQPNVEVSQHYIGFVLRNSGKGFGAVTTIGVTIQTIDSNQRERSEFTSANWNGGLESGESSEGHHVTSALVGVAEYDLIMKGQLALFANFEILSQDIFHNQFRQIFPFVYNVRISAFQRAPSQWSKEQAASP
ncbi:MAG TPA: hypothetical protein VFA80_10370 [Xanthobacteraceae bacterium]|nr:hypothetical protein [Xanthobacteraceae bacterium]